MILDELVLQDFGVYGGRQSVKLTPQRPGRPIILIGGLNGGGKTTLLDALQLCLYGPLARCSNRGGLAYDEYLARSVHRPVGKESGREAAVELSFSHASDGQQHHFTLKRAWKVNPSGTRESFEVIRNGEMDRQATEQWAELVEDFIPAAIAPLFFFDGEKVERYAELDSAPELIRTAIHNLLGLEIVERLGTDLQVLERRKRTESAAPETAVELAAIESRIKAAGAERKNLISERASVTNTLDRRALELATLEGQYRREGGTLFEERSGLEANAAKLEAGLLDARRELLALAEDATPLLLVPRLLDDVLYQAQAEEHARHLEETAAAIRQEHDAVFALQVVQELPKAVQQKIRRDLEKRMRERAADGKVAKLLKLQPQARGWLSSLMGEELPALRGRVRESCVAEGDLAQAFQQAKDAVSSIPSQDAIDQVAKKCEVARQEVARLKAEQEERTAAIVRLDKELAQLRDRESRIAETAYRERFEDEDVQRLLTHSAKVRGTLQKFREAIVARHIARIERLVLESFQQLLRKQSLVSSLTIDPATFRLDLRGPGGTPLTTDRLSAGERQLLAIAILWGLGRSSGRPLPTIIDTPLGRLDSIHRDHLVKRYFPQASHQVLLLSTDEEITGEYLEGLKPAIDRTYHLVFDEASGRTVIGSGYLSEARANGH